MLLGGVCSLFIQIISEEIGNLNEVKNFGFIPVVRAVPGEYGGRRALAQPFDG